ncbi:MAG: Crp/Fnr family transcriptional regulator [Clostridiales bacterium]|nr:Crp/Fnr family transcriptional regulator [Clostridiales bacterium]
MLNILQKSILFKNLAPENIEHLLKFIGTEKRNYDKNETIFLEDDLCDSVGVVLEGSVELQSIFPSGKVITHLELSSSEVFGEGLIFSQINRYPITVSSKNKSSVLYIKKENLIHGLLHHPILLQNLLNLLSDKLYYMNNKVKILSLSTLRKKIAMYLLSQYKESKSSSFDIKLNRKRLSEHLAVERPSLSRELIRMKDDGLIDFDQSSFKILDIEALEAELFK